MFKKLNKIIQLTMALCLAAPFYLSATEGIQLTLRVSGVTEENKKCLMSLPRTNNLSVFAKNLEKCHVIFVGKGIFRPINLNDLPSNIVIVASE